MFAIRPTHPGGPELLTLAETPTPAPGPGSVLIRVEAAGVNFIDIYHRTGLYPMPTPLPLGLEGAGTVEAVGPEVTTLAPGDRVAWASVTGSYATHVVAPVEKLVKVPEGVGLKVAAAAMLQGMTAHYLAHATYPLTSDSRCLVHAAAGGVGLLLCQMAKRLGARVIGVVSTEEKAKLARGAGADQVVLGTKDNYSEAALQFSDGRGVDVVYDSVGKDTFEGSLNCLRRRGMLVLYGQSSGPVPPVNLQILAQKGSLYLTRPSLGDYTATPDELRNRAEAVLGALQRGELTVTVGATFPLADAALAHAALEGRKTVGKVLLLP
jgi:NADPH2:quinone reductase